MFPSVPTSKPQKIEPQIQEGERGRSTETRVDRRSLERSGLLDSPKEKRKELDPNEMRALNLGRSRSPSQGSEDDFDAMFSGISIPTRTNDNNTQRERTTGLNPSRTTETMKTTLERAQWFGSVQGSIAQGSRDQVFAELSKMPCPYGGAWTPEKRMDFAGEKFGVEGLRNAMALNEAITDGRLPASYAVLMMDPGLMIKGQHAFVRDTERGIMPEFIKFASQQPPQRDPWAVRAEFAQSSSLQMTVYRGMAVEPNTHQSIIEKGFLPNISTKLTNTGGTSPNEVLAAKNLQSFDIGETASQRVRASSSNKSQQEQVNDYTFSVTRDPQLACAVAKDFAKEAKTLQLYELQVSGLDVFSFADLKQSWRSEFQLTMTPPKGGQAIEKNAALPEVESFMLMKINPSEITNSSTVRSEDAWNYSCSRL
jgi:hypothetical protein